MSRLTVPGEDVHLSIPMGLTAIGIAAAFGATSTLSDAAVGPDPTTAPTPTPRATIETTTEPPRDLQPIPDAGPVVCPRLIVVFTNASALPPEAASEAAARYGRWLEEHPGASAVIDGHADSVGDDHGNLALSKRRANAVAALLVKAGVARTRLTVRGFGAYLPIEGTPEEAAANRRVVVQVRGTDECPLEREEVIFP